MDTVSTLDDRARRQVLVAGVVLLACQVVHDLAQLLPEAGRREEEAGLSSLLGVLTIVVPVVVLAGAWRRRGWAPAALAATGALTALGYVAYHGWPRDTSFNNPYWGDGSATLAQLLTVLAVLAASLGCVLVGLRGRRP